MQQQEQPYLQLPQLLELFKTAPTFVANKPYKAIPLAADGTLIVESHIAEHMAANQPTAEKSVTKGQFTLINTSQFEMAQPFLDENDAITPTDLMAQHIEVMDVFSEEELARATTSHEGVYYLDPVVETIIAPEDMLIPSFMEPRGVESVRQGQILMKTPILGILPYQRPYKSLTQDSSFLEAHLPVVEGSVCTLEHATSMHQSFAEVLMQQENTSNVIKQNFA